MNLPRGLSAEVDFHFLKKVGLFLDMLVSHPSKDNVIASDI